MKKSLFTALSGVTATICLAVFFSACGGSVDSAKEPALLSNTEDMISLTSNAFNDGETIPSEYTCDGENVSPALSIAGVPEGAASLALIVNDPDAPAGDWIHWTVWNISPDTTEIAEGSAPAGAVQGVTDFGKNGYGGPCPPSGTHKYVFRIYALDTTLPLPSDSDSETLKQAMEGHILAEGKFTGLYERSR